AVALEVARRAVVLLDDDGTLPLRPGARLAVLGPLADDPMGMLGCYSFPAHVGVRHPDHAMGIDIPSVLDQLVERHAGGDAAALRHVRGCAITGDDRSGVEEAVSAAREAEVAVVVVGDQAGLFGRGTSGEGCDATDLRLPGVQEDLVRAVLDTGTPVVLVLLTGRPYALGDLAERSAAVVQGFFPGQRGGQAVAEVLTGQVNPSGRLPVSLPREVSGQPGTYLAAPLARRSGVSNVDPTPLYPFGHGRGYTSFSWEDVRGAGSGDAGLDAARADRTAWRVDGEATVEVTVRNTGGR
ncbi:glycoside hydrolase family 3 C-terminal domain-containing protein, partial [Actinotalea sp. C106]|uniref:glycoside hydrolase family 3 C-terminal domain-containing protein n=1 Tax=Actinotalea sp. C106 TaxID=2908644 RepID=UPI0020289579